MKPTLTSLLAALTLLAALATPLHAQEKTAPEPVTASDPAIPVDYLDLMLDPLTKEELQVEAEAWRDLVKAKSQSISDGEIGLRQATQRMKEEGDETAKEGLANARERAMQNLASLREERAALLERFNTVLDALEIKGGDPTELRQYADAVSAIKVDARDTSAAWNTFSSWLTSGEGGVKWALRLAQFLVIMAVAWFAASAVGGFVKRYTEHSDRMSELHERFLNRIARNLILFIGLLVALSTVGVEVGAMLALVGGGAFILGFALQDSLGNFAAGAMLLFYRPFDAGDVVEIGGTLGIVDCVSMVSTTIKTFDNKTVIVPNSQVWGQVITNVTANENRRVDLVFGCSYDDDVDKAKEILRKVVAEHDLVLDDPAPLIELQELADSSVNFICRPWTATDNYGRVMWDITERVKKEFDAAGLSIPYPQRDVHVYEKKKTG